MSHQEIDEAVQTLIQKARTISREVASPHAADVDRSGRFPQESMGALAESGLLGICVDRAHGGLGQGPRTFTAIADELAQGCASTAMIYVMHVTAAQAIAASPVLATRDGLLRDIAAGKHLTTLALSERGSRSNFWAPVSQLRPAGDGFTVSAQKSWVTAADHADSYVASSQVPGAASPLESTCYLVRRGATGVRTMGRFDGMGLRGNESSPVALSDVAIARGDLVSEPGKGAATKLEVVLPWFAAGTAAMANGLCAAAIAATVDHLSSSELEHTGQKLRDLPNLRGRVALMYARTEASRALVARTTSEMESAAPTAPLYVLSSRLAALEAALEVTDLAMKACGGAAFSRQVPVDRHFRDARAGWVMAPTVDHLQDFLGKALTGLPLF
ncbi:MAG: acyl-CoA dehydrogenase family protein [Acidobacteriota bacterium]